MILQDEGRVERATPSGEPDAFRTVVAEPGRDARRPRPRRGNLGGMSISVRPHAVRHHWPAALGLLAALAVLAAGADRDVVAITVIAATVCYLAAAALDRPWVAWAAVLGTVVVVVAGRLLGAPPWVSLGVTALVLVVVGLVGGVPRHALAAQTAAVLLYGGVAVSGLLLSPGAGLVVVAVTLVAHGIWDVVHFRRDVVVPRSLAQACVWLDVPLGTGVLVLAALA